MVMKIYWGDAREKIVEAIDKIPLGLLVIGNRGLASSRGTDHLYNKHVFHFEINYCLIFEFEFVFVCFGIF